MSKYRLDIMKKTKKGFKKRLMKGIKIFLDKLKTKRVNILLNDIKVFPKKRKTKNKNMVPNNIKIFLKMKKKG